MREPLNETVPAAASCVRWDGGDMNNIVNICLGMVLQAFCIYMVVYWHQHHSWIGTAAMFAGWLFAGRGVIWRAQTMALEGEVKGINWRNDLP